MIITARFWCFSLRICNITYFHRQIPLPSQLLITTKRVQVYILNLGKQTLKLVNLLKCPCRCQKLDCYSWPSMLGTAWYGGLTSLKAENQSRGRGGHCALCVPTSHSSVFPIVPRCKHYPHPRCTSEAGGFRKWVLVTTLKTTRSRKDASRDTLCFAWTSKSELCCSETTPIPGWLHHLGSAGPGHILWSTCEMHGCKGPKWKTGFLPGHLSGEYSALSTYVCCLVANGVRLFCDLMDCELPLSPVSATRCNIHVLTSTPFLNLPQGYRT